MPAISDPREIEALLNAFSAISKFLGKEFEYSKFTEYINWAESNHMTPSIDEIAQHTPMWVQAFTLPFSHMERYLIT